MTPTQAAPSNAAAPAAKPASSTRHLVLTTLSLAALLTAYPAPPSRAAFDLVPSHRPVTMPQSPPTQVPGATPAPSASPGLVTPLKPSASTVTTTPLAPITGTAPGAAPVPSPADNHTVRGRANDVALAGVIRSIVPPTMTIVPMPPDIATRHVSFAGNNRPWRDVLSESLARANLTFREDGNHLTVTAAAPSVLPSASNSYTTPHGGSSTATAAPVPLTPLSAAASTIPPSATAPAQIALARSAPLQIVPPAPPPSSTPLASAAAPLSASPPAARQDAKEGDPSSPPPADHVQDQAQIRAAANAPAPLPFGAAPPADGFEAAKRSRVWTVHAGETVRSTIARWASSLGLPIPEDVSGYSWSFSYGATVRNKTYFEALEWLTSGAEDKGVRADWEFSSTTLVTTIKRKDNL